jgi:hypothetical protein
MLCPWKVHLKIINPISEKERPDQLLSKLTDE